MSALKTVAIIAGALIAVRVLNNVLSAASKSKPREPITPYHHAHWERATGFEWARQAHNDAHTGAQHMHNQAHQHACNNNHC